MSINMPTYHRVYSNNYGRDLSVGYGDDFERQPAFVYVVRVGSALSPPLQNHWVVAPGACWPFASQLEVELGVLPLLTLPVVVAAFS